MNASSRPPRRRKSALAGEHPAWPTTEPEPPVRPPETQPEPDTTPVAPQLRHAELVSRVYARTRAREDQSPPGRAGTPAEVRARKLARDAAFGYAAAVRKADRRLGEWAETMDRARSLGTTPAVLHSYITEAADKAGMAETGIPAEVWDAAGLTPPTQPTGDAGTHSASG